MNRKITALCAALMLAGLWLPATPAAAYVGDYSFSDRGTVELSSTQRAASRKGRAAARSADWNDEGAQRTTRRARRGGSMSSLTGGGGGGGIASYYWQPQRVASGGWFNPNAMTAAHKTLPFGTRVRVTNLNNGRSVVVRINDRGPYIRGRVIDLSRAAASAVGMIGSGIARVNIAVLGR